MSFSPDGALLASGSNRGIILWDAIARKQIVTLEGHTHSVRSVAFSPDGTLLASAGDWNDFTIKLWDVASRKLHATLEGHSEQINAVAFSPDGTVLASGSGVDYSPGSEDQTVRLWDVVTQTEVVMLRHSDGVYALAFSPDGATLASGEATENPAIRLWDVATQTEVTTLRGHVEGIWALAFSPDGATLASAGVHFSVRLWDLGLQKEAANFAGQGHTWGIPSVAFSPDGALLASGSSDGTVKLWNMSEWTGPRPFALEIVSGDGQQGAPGAALAQPLVVEVRDQFGDLLPEATVAFTVTAGEGQLSGRFTVEHITTDADGRAELILTLGPQPGQNIVGVTLGGHELATFTAEGVGTAVAELEEDYRTWHLPTAATVRLGKGALGESDRAVALSADGRCLAVASAIGVWLYEASTSRAQALLPSESAVHSVAFSLGGTLAAGLNNGQVELWEVETGERIGTLRHAERGRVTSVAFSKDRTTLASGSWEQVIKLWDVETRREVGTWEVPREGNSVWPLSVAFSPDGSRLVSGFHDGTVRLWDIATQTELATLEGHTDQVTSVSFSPDGALLASAGGWSDPTVRLWDAETQTEVATLRGHTGEVRSVSFFFA